MTISERITRLQHIIDDHLSIYQAYIDSQNGDESVEDVYRNELLKNLEKLDNSIFEHYKGAQAIIAAKTFNIPPGDDFCCGGGGGRGGRL